MQYFHPIAQFLRHPTADVARKVRLRADQPAQADELMSPEAVVLNVIAPMNVDGLRTLRLWADAITPVVIICEASTRPAQYWHSELLQVLNAALP